MFQDRKTGSIGREKTWRDYKMHSLLRYGLQKRDMPNIGHVFDCLFY